MRMEVAMRYALRVLQFLWILPAWILMWLFYVLPMWLIFRDLVFVRWADFLVAEFELATENLEPWFAKLWRGWIGFGGPGVIIRKVIWDEASRERTRKHELTHVQQQYRWGLLFYPAYLFVSVWIWIFMRDLHSYYDNPFEVEARRAAGQQVKIRKSQWRDGIADRWAWW